MLGMSIKERLKARAEQVRDTIADIRAQAAMAQESKTARIDQLEDDLREIENIVKGLPR